MFHVPIRILLSCFFLFALIPRLKNITEKMRNCTNLPQMIEFMRNTTVSAACVCVCVCSVHHNQLSHTVVSVLHLDLNFPLKGRRLCDFLRRVSAASCGRLWLLCPGRPCYRTALSSVWSSCGRCCGQPDPSWRWHHLLHWPCRPDCREHTWRKCEEPSRSTSNKEKLTVSLFWNVQIILFCSFITSVYLSLSHFIYTLL